jgi:COMPASS component BRE2
VNFGDGPAGFWAPPAHLMSTRATASGPDVVMQDAGIDASGDKNGWNPGRTCRPIGERYKEQVAEDVVWDIIDEADFFMQDGGPEGKVGSGGTDRLATRLKDED